MFARERRPEESHMRRSLSHRYQQGQSQFQVGTIPFFDDRHRVECRSGAPLLAGFARSEFRDASTGLKGRGSEPRRCIQIKWAAFSVGAFAGWNKASGF
jgi:hypothetical protein